MTKIGGAGYMVKTGITLDTKSAEKSLNNLNKILNGLIETQNAASKKLNSIQDRSSDEYKETEKIFKEASKRVKEQERVVKAYESSVNRIKHAMKGLAGMSMSELKATAKEVQTQLNKLSLSDADQKKAVELNRLLRNVNLEMENMKSGFVNLRAQMKDYSKLSVDELEKLAQRLRANRDAMSQRANGSFDKQMYDAIGKNIQQIMLRAEQLKGVEGTLKDLNKANNKELEHALEVYQKLVDSGEVRSRQLRQAQEHIADIRKQMADNAINSKSNSMTDLTQRTSVLQDYRKTLDAKTQTAEIQRVDEAIRQLRQNTILAVNGFSDMKDVLVKLDPNKTFDGTLDDLANMKRAMEDYRNTIKLTDAKALKDVDTALAQINRLEQENIQSSAKFNQTISQPKGASYNDLKAAAERLKNELKQCADFQGEYNEKSARLREVNARIKELEAGWQEHSSTLANAVDRLKNYVLTYMGFRELLSKGREFFTGNLELSDQMANIQKVTYMTNEEIRALVSNIQELDSRTSQSNLLEFATQAGKLGLYTQYGVKGVEDFTKVAEKMMATLGEDAGAQAIADVVKINGILGETEKLGGDVGVALDAAASSILSVTNQSSASVGPLLEMIGRIGGISSAVGMTMPQMVAFAGSMDAMKINAEAGSTAFAQFVSAVMTHTDEMAKAAGLNTVEFRKLVQGYTDEMGNLVGPDMYAAVVQLIDAINRGAVSAQGLMDNMSGRGKQSQQIRNLLLLLGSDQGYGMLTKQLEYANAGYESATRNLVDYSDALAASVQVTQQASLMSQEFQRVNNNAAGIFERMKNDLYELFVNNKIVDVIKSLLDYFVSAVHWLAKSESGLTTLRVAIAAIISQIVILKLELNKTSVAVTLNTKGFTGLWVALKTNATQMWKNVTVGKVFCSVMHQAGRATGLLARALKANLFGLFITGISMAVTWIIDFVSSTDKMTKKISEAAAEMEAERNAANALFSALKNANLGEKERANILQTINDKYGKYLGYMLTENNYMTLQEAALKRINAQLREQARLKQNQAIVEEATKANSTEILESMEGIREKANKAMPNSSDKVQKMIDDVLVPMMNEGITDEKKILTKIRETFDAANMKDVKMDIWEDVRKYVKLNVDTREKMNAALSRAENSDKYIREQGAKETRALDINESNRLLETMSGMVSGGKVIDIKKSGEYIQMAERYVELMGKYKEQSADTAKNVDMMTNAIKVQKNVLKDYNARVMREALWGDNGDGSYTAMKAEDLKSRYDELEKYTSQVNSNNGQNIKSALPGLYNMISENGKAMDDDQIRTYLKSEAEKIKNELERRGLTTDLNFKWQSKSAGSIKKELKEQMNAYLQALDEYYEARKTAIEEKRANEQISEAEMNRQTEANEKEHLEARIRLRRQYIQQEGFELSQEEMDAMNAYFEGIGRDDVSFSKEGINNLAKKISDTFGGAFTQEIGNRAQKDATSVQKIIIKQNDRIRKILENDNPFLKLRTGLKDDLDDLNLLLADYTNAADGSMQEMMMNHVNFLIEQSKRAYTLTADGLKQAMVDAGFADWAATMTDDSLQVMINQLQNFSTEYENAVKQLASKTEKLYEAMRKQNGLDKPMEDTEKAYKNEENRQSRRKKFVDQLTGLMGEDSEGELGMSLSDQIDLQMDAQQLELLKEKVKYQMEYVELLRAEYDQKILAARERGDDEEADELELAKLQSMKDANEKLLEVKQNVIDKESELTEKSMEIAAKAISEMQPYMDSLSTFSESFGEAIFGSKEDRQQAAKQLLKDFAQTTLNLLKERLMYLVKSQLLDKQEIVQKQVTNATMNAIDKASAAEEIGTEAAVATGEVTIEQAKSTAKAFGKSFWIGLAVSAAIAAAFAGLMGMINGALSSTSSSLGTSSTSSNKRMSTGMLTYAEGKYPVLGNDGKTYDAKYQSELKTGIYNGPHFGIFSEKKPEAVIDGDTTQRLVMNYPAIWDAIKTISKNGRLVNGGAGVMATHAAGTLDAVQAKYAGINADVNADANTGAGGNNDTNAMLLAAINLLNSHLSNGITAKMNYFGPDGERERMQAAERFAKRTGI